MAASTYLLISSAGSKAENTEARLRTLNTSLSRHILGQAQITKLHVPDGQDALRFESFDHLIRFTDDLAKSDGQVEVVLRRMERQLLDIVPDDATLPFHILSQRVQMPFESYITDWVWDEAKFPKQRGIFENLQSMLHTVSKLDEEVRLRVSQYNDVKSQLASSMKHNSGNLFTCDFVEILKPERVERDAFIYSEHLTTIIVVVPKGGEQEFLSAYESMDGGVVPRSARQLDFSSPPVDKDGNTLWRVVLLKDAAENFRQACRGVPPVARRPKEVTVATAVASGSIVDTRVDAQARDETSFVSVPRKFTVRDFEYREEAYAQLLEQRDELREETEKLLENLKRLVAAAWSDVMVAWVHIKVMRVFVESLLRYGVNGPDASTQIPLLDVYLLPTSTNSMTTLHQDISLALEKVSGVFSKSAKTNAAAAEAEGEEYLPYVSVGLTPFLSAQEV